MEQSETIETTKKKHPGGRKPKYDYESREFLSTVEEYAKKGLTDKEIAFALNLCPQKFCEKKGKYSELRESLARGRAKVTTAVRAKFLSLALGGVKTKTTVTRKLRDPDGNVTDAEEIQTTEIEIAPSLQALSSWLYHYDEEWRKVERKQDEESDIPQDIQHGVDIDSWIKEKVK